MKIIIIILGNAVSNSSPKVMKLEEKEVVNESSKDAEKVLSESVEELKETAEI